MKLRKLVLLVVLLSIIWSITGCSCNDDEDNNISIPEANDNESPVDYIVIFRGMENIPPSGNLGTKVDPYPQDIQEVLYPGEKFFIGVSMNRANTEDVTFEKFTYYNRSTGKENVMPYPDDAGTFKPGGIYLINFDDPWLVQGQLGIVEIRVYYKNEIVASALFEVQENPHQGDIIVDHAGSTNGFSVRFSGTSKLPDGTVLVSKFFEDDTELSWWPEDREIIVENGEWEIIVQESENITASDLELLAGPYYYFKIWQRDAPEIKSGITFDLVGPPPR